MKILIIFTLCPCLGIIAGSLAGVGEPLDRGVELGRSESHVFVTTNSGSDRFPLVATNIDLASMVGAKLNTNLINSSSMELRAQYSPSAKLNHGRYSPWGYIVYYGQYAKLDGKVLTLTDFEMKISDDAGTKCQVLCVKSTSCSFEVSSSFVTQAERIKSQARSSPDRMSVSNSVPDAGGKIK